MELPLPTEQSPGPGPAESPWLIGPFPNSELPEQVTAEFGKLTLFADHDHVEEAGVPLYLVNRSRTPTRFFTYGGDPGIVLERRDEETGEWHRAQAGMVSFAMCGLSFHSTQLLPGQHFRIPGYRPKEGREGEVRFRLRSVDLISNAGVGFWSEQDEARAGIDTCEIGEYPFASDLMHWSLQRGGANGKSTERVVAELELMQIWDDGPVFRVFAEAFKEDLLRHRDAGGDLSDALASIDAMIAKKPVRRSEQGAFLGTCLRYLHGPREERFGSPGKNREVLWAGLSWLERQSVADDDPRWRAVFEALPRMLPEAGTEEIVEMGRLIGGSSRAYEYLTKDFLEQAAKEHPELLDACAERLAGLGAWRALLRVAQGRDVEFRLRVLRYFCMDPAVGSGARSLRVTHDPSEIEFWKACLRDAPWRSVEVMDRALGRRNEGFHIVPGLSLVLMEQADAFCGKALRDPWPVADHMEQSGLLAYIKVIGRESSPKHRILHRFRELGEISPEGETERQSTWRKSVAAEAKRRLLAAGWSPGQTDE